MSGWTPEFDDVELVCTHEHETYVLKGPEGVDIEYIFCAHCDAKTGHVFTPQRRLIRHTPVTRVIFPFSYYVWGRFSWTERVIGIIVILLLVLLDR